MTPSTSSSGTITYPYMRMQWLLLKANFLYYTRSKKAMQEVWQLAKRQKLGMGTVFTFMKDYFWGK